MGGLVSSEVALAQAEPGPAMRHAILGTINFDVPFLGMHPGVVKSGLASIFSPAPDPQTSQPEPSSSSTTSFSAEGGAASTATSTSTPPALPPRRIDTLFNPAKPDPNYNPAFDNDVRLPVRKGWRNAWHFVSKHNEDLFAATKQLVKSHMEFGGAMADYNGLKKRYCRIRALEEQNMDVRTSIMGPGSHPPRVRFVNYYTSSTGRPKVPKTPVVVPDTGVADGVKPADVGPNVVSVAREVPVADGPASLYEGASLVESESPLVLVEHADDDLEPSEYDLEESNDALDKVMDHLDPAPMSDLDEEDASESESWTDAMEDMELSNSKTTAHLQEELTTPLEKTLTPTSTTSTLMEPTTSSTPTTTSAVTSTLSLATTTSTLPPLPDPPPKPPTPDFSTYTDKDLRKLAEKDHARTLKTWERATKDNQRALRDREKLEQKRHRDLLKQGKRAERDSEKDARRKEKEAETAAKKKEKVKEASMEEVFKIQRRETEREWREALDMKWNDEDGTVTPMTSGVSSSHAAASLAPTMSTTSAASESAASLAAMHAVAAARETTEREKDKPRKERTFCTLPPKDAAGNRDPCWLKVFMPDVDEVGAHCGLFFETSPAYQQLVGDVGEKVSQWVQEAEGERVAREIEDGPD